MVVKGFVTLAWVYTVDVIFTSLDVESCTRVSSWAAPARRFLAAIVSPHLRPQRRPHPPLST